MVKFLLTICQDLIITNYIYLLANLKILYNQSGFAIKVIIKTASISAVPSNIEIVVAGHVIIRLDSIFCVQMQRHLLGK
jgi:hypothetical protein